MEYTDIVTETYNQLISEIALDKQLGYEVIAYLSMVHSVGPIALPAHLRRWLDEKLIVIKNNIVDENNRS
jgi:hypothetical protein